MMRITNAMMTSNTKNNININKLNEDRLNTQISTGQVISRPSEDPVVAIRALRLNTNLSQLTQYYKKNIPDAQAWMNVTETALKQTNEIFTNIKENLTAGASDNHTATDRQKILESLKGLRSELYSSGNADYAERTVFTGYRTGESLTFLATDKDLNWNYKIHETFDVNSLETFNYVTCGTQNTATPPAEDYQTDEKYVTRNDISRIRLAYDTLDKNLADGTIKLTAGEGGSAVTDNIAYKTKSIAGLSQAKIDEIYTDIPDNEAVFIPETGELLLSKGAAAKYTKFFSDNLDKSPAPSASFEYDKDQWQSGDLRPEHYFACVQTDEDGKDIYYNYDPKLDGSGKPLVPTEPDPNKPHFVNQDLEVEISFNQKITINTHANEVYTHDIGRDVDELLAATQATVDADEKRSTLKKALSSMTEGTTEYEETQKKLAAAEKEFSFRKDKMQKLFSAGLDTFAGYADRNDVAIANIGSMQSRLTITKERVADQLQSFKELADSNINAELTESSIDFASAKLALEAAQLAAGKIAQQTLLNYL
ncbi:MAG: hypothetical protein IJI51_04260 [Lachnospiraceae bacterium]|nr:hypothetical protein [Lachnospiraceae bacterium]